MGRLPLRARAFLLSLVALAALMLIDAASLGVPADTRALMLCGVTLFTLILAGMHPIELSHTTKLNVSTAIEFALPLIVGPALAMWTVAACALALTRWHMTKRAWRWYNVAFNAANTVVSVGTAGLVYAYTAGSSGLLTSADSITGVAIAGATYFALNIGSIAVMVSLARNADTVASFLSAFRVAAPQFVGLMALGLVAAMVYAVSAVAAGLLLIPLVAVYFSLKSTLALRAETKHALEVLAIQVDHYHPYTAEHSDRVARYASRIARRMCLAQDQVDMITRAARIHDLGKLGIWRDMLNKTAALTPEERAEIETHPARGAELVSQFADYRNGRDLILHHHERYDGTGYPNKLKGDEIPLGARIIAVADAADAMMSDRPYRKALGVPEVMRELEKNRGKQFDPEVVDVMLTILDMETSRATVRSLSRSQALA